MAPVGRPRSRTAIGTSAPTREIGSILGGTLSPAGMAPWSSWSSFVDDYEYVPELIWPNSIKTYEMMRNDSQVAALYKATVLGIGRFKWSIDPNGSGEGMAEKISKDYNLPILGEKINHRLRAKRRFAFKQHMKLAFLAGIYGHYPFEQIGYIGDGRQGRETDGMWHLLKLAERPPRTIQDFRLADDGGLISIIQNVTKGNIAWGMLPEIPIDNLVMYVWDKEGANWAGRSWLRELYKDWVVKDRLVRIDAINHERAGGVPYIEAHPGATYAEVRQLNEMAQQFRIGDTAGGAVPFGAKLQIAKGTNSSVVDSIRYHDEAMARTFMLMVMQLGQTQSGSRALGTTFIDFWATGLASIADWFKDTFNEHVIEDDIDWNWGEDVDQVPLLHYEFDPELVVADLKNLIDSGAIVIDDDLEHHLRKELGLPEKGTPRLNPAQQLEKDRLDQDAELAEADREAAAEIAESNAKQAASQQADTTAAKPNVEGAPSRRWSLRRRPNKREEA